jgi:glycosyltransferase involved in cell wall biosynthesis
VLPDLVAEGGTGLLVEPGNAAALAEGVSGLLANPARGREMGEAGRRRLVERFGERNSLDRLEELYRELTAESPTRQSRFGDGARRRGR